MLFSDARVRWKGQEDKCVIFSGGALLIMTAMCCWLRAPNRTSVSDHDVIISMFIGH